MGAGVDVSGSYHLSTQGLRGADVFLDEPSVTATENALVAAVAATGTTVLRNAASEPHVQDLARFLVAMGATIEGIGTKVQQWILSRLWRKHKFGNISAHSMEIEVTVKLDGEPIDHLTLPLTLTSPDGGHRWRAFRSR